MVGEQMPFAFDQFTNSECQVSSNELWMAFGVEQVSLVAPLMPETDCRSAPVGQQASFDFR